MSDTTLNRAQFLRVAGALAGGAALPGLAGAALADEAPVAEIAWDDEADVVVCGCGTTGAPAAIEACEAGADVLVLEKMGWIGGCMRRCGGGFMAAGTKVQEKLGVDDNPDMLYDYLVALTAGYGNPELIRVYADEAAPTFDWILDHLNGQPLEEWEFASEDEGSKMWIGPGLNIGGTPVYYDEVGLPELYRPRCHWFKPNPDDVDPGDRIYAFYGEGDERRGDAYGGTGLWKPFEDKLTELGVRIETNTEFTGLIQDAQTGEILGVTALVDGAKKKIKARKGVVLASGGFSNNGDLYNTFTGNEYKAPTKEQSQQGSYIEGEADGAALKAGLAAGAALTYPVLGNNGGLRMTTKAEIMGMDGNPIPRLYGGGRVTGGLAASEYPSCGFYIGTGVVFGRIAGQQAAALEPWA